MRSVQTVDCSFEVNRVNFGLCAFCSYVCFPCRDILTANTTEAEFKQVLEGICKQTKSFKAECLSITDQYYDVIYNTLTKELDPAGACFMIGVCPKGYSSAQVYVCIIDNEHDTFQYIYVSILHKIDTKIAIAPGPHDSSHPTSEEGSRC